MPAVILLGHGSRRTKQSRPLEGLCMLLQNAEGRPVTDAYLSLCPPTMEESVEKLVAQGARAVDIVPMFLVTGHHVTVDLPQSTARIRVLYPGLILRVTPNLAADAAILPLLSRRLTQAEPVEHSNLQINVRVP
jgi:sirohydrochlorin cobaltochelatase